MLGRIRGFLRDAWWLVLVLAAGSIFLWVMVAAVLGIATLCICLGISTYFALMRYDNDGNEIPQGPG